MSDIAPKKLRGKRHSVSPAALAVSQANSEATLGIPPRKHLELVKTLRIPHSRIGSLVVVEIDDYLAALRRHRVEPANDDSTGIDVEAVRRSLGLTKL